MCGIFGVIHPAPGAQRVASAMDPLLRHRGPDGHGIETVPGAILGHRRLSILDLTEAGSQPMWSVGREACIVFNGEIYNFGELRDECTRAGLPFRSRSDTEVILNQYLLHGEAAFERINGMYAFCLWDMRTEDAFLARDPIGIKPLYWARTPMGTWFASELRALTASGAVGVEIDAKALQAYLQLDFVPAPLCIVKGVSKLERGQCLRIERNGTMTSRNITVLQADREAGSRSLVENVAELDARLHDAVARQLVADVPVGVFLSGGIDSSVVAWVASRVSSRRIATFSVGFEEPSFDESRWAAEVARAVGSYHHAEILDAKRMMDLLPRLAEITSEPLADGSIFPTALLSKFTRESVKVALSGDGGDELFGGYPTHGILGMGAASSALPGPLRNGLLWAARHTLKPRYENFSFDFKLSQFLRGLHRDPVIRNQRWLGTFTPAELPALFPAYDPGVQEQIEAMFHEPSVGHEGLEAILRTDQRFYMQDGVLVKVDRASMAGSLEVRVPLLDDVIVTFARGLRPAHKVHRGTGKVLLRAWAKGRLPAPIIDRPKKGFGAPLGRWFRSELREFLLDTLLGAGGGCQGHVERVEVSRLVTEHLEGRSDHRKKLFNVMALVLWCAMARADRAKASIAP